MTIIGIQEARTHQGAITTGGYYIISAGRTKAGSHGCELWIATKVHYATIGGTKAYLKSTDVVAIHADPTLLVCSISAPALDIIVVVALAPHTGKPMEEINAFWKRANAIVRQARKGRPAMFLGDTNAAVGSEESAAIGSHQPAKEHKSGELFHKFFIDQKLVAPATFAQWQKGPGNTWRHPSGALSRKDFVAVSEDWAPLVQQARVASAVDITTVKEDHSVATLHIQGAVPDTDGDEGAHKLMFDKSLLRDPVKVAAFQNDISRMPAQKPNVDVDTHQQSTVHGVRELIEPHFPNKVKSPTAPWMSTNT